MGSAGPLTMGKQVKAIATLSRDRSPLMPDLPTAQEQGLADFDVVTWNAFFLPKGAPLEVVKKLKKAACMSSGFQVSRSSADRRNTLPSLSSMKSPAGRDQSSQTGFR